MLQWRRSGRQQPGTGALAAGSNAAAGGGLSGADGVASPATGVERRSDDAGATAAPLLPRDRRSCDTAATPPGDPAQPKNVMHIRVGCTIHLLDKAQALLNADPMAQSTAETGPDADTP